MHRFYLPPDQCRGSTLVFSEREAHHAAHVLRLSAGAPITVLDGVGGTIEATVSEASKKQFQATVVSRHQAEPLPCRIILAQAIPKGKLMESIIQKATELGVARVVPLVTERVVSHFDDDGASHKEERWQQTAIEAIKQSGAAWLPKISAPVPLKRFVAEDAPAELALIGSLRSDARHPRVYFDEFRKNHGRQPASICLWVGPEGDFTDGEIEAVRAAGAKPINLGPLVLRCETAATYCLAVANHEIRADIVP